MSNPIFQQVPDDLTEDWHWGLLIGGMAEDRDEASVAKAYKEAGDLLTREAVNSRLPWELAYPILFVYRHSVELYLKAVLKPKKRNHKLTDLIVGLEAHASATYGRSLAPQAKAWLEELASFDENSTTFRYAGPARSGMLAAEHWVDLHHLMEAMRLLCCGFEQLLHPSST